MESNPQIDLRVQAVMDKPNTLKIKQIEDSRLTPGKYHTEGWYGIAAIAPFSDENIRDEDVNWRISIAKSDKFDDVHPFSPPDYRPFPHSYNVLLYREEIWMSTMTSFGMAAMTQSQGMPWGMFARPLEVDIEKLYLCINTHGFKVPGDATVCVLVRRVG